ncbi:hypothetical protein [Acinetobacter calcoaceticus]
MTTSRPKPQFNKPVDNDRFSTAANFAKSTDDVVPSTVIEDEGRESWECPNDLRKELKHFIVDSKRFKTKKEFLTQCLKDGLEKYQGK